jgi:hypothetical protein
MAVRFQEILDAVEAVSSGHRGENSAWLCKQSGQIYWQFGNDDESEELPDDIGVHPKSETRKIRDSSP